MVRAGRSKSIPNASLSPERARDHRTESSTSTACSCPTRRGGFPARPSALITSARCLVEPSSVPPWVTLPRPIVDPLSLRHSSERDQLESTLKSPQNGDFCCLIWYNRAPPSQGGDRGSTAARHLRELLEINDVSLGPRPRCEAGDRFWGLMTAGLGRMARRRVH